MKNKKLIIAVLALVLVIAAMFGVYTLTRPEAVEGEKNVTVIIIYGNDHSFFFESTRIFFYTFINFRLDSSNVFSID